MSNKKEPHVEVIRMLTIIKENNEKEIERLKLIPGSKKVREKVESQNKKIQKGINKLRKDKSEKVVQQNLF